MKVCVVGAGTHFLSGLSYYTLRLVNALSGSHTVSVILMRQLLPTALYPGHKRVGAPLTGMEYQPEVRVFNGVDWFWWPSMFRGMCFLLKERPEVVVFQWWSGTVVHSYLLLALVARLLGAKVIIEFHEVLDPAEATIPVVQAYIKLVTPWLMRMANAFVVHAVQDKPILEKRYGISSKQLSVIPHGPYDHHTAKAEQQVYREAPKDCFNFLFFGLIRPYKGLDNLIAAFNAIPETEIGKYWLTIVGETWENWETPADLIKNSPYRNRISFINRYVSDEEASAIFAGADALVLPYRRSSGSGCLSIALSQGLPVLITEAGGLLEAVAGYEGVLTVPVDDVVALLEALPILAQLKDRRFTNHLSWATVVANYSSLFKTLSDVQKDEVKEGIAA